MDEEERNVEMQHLVADIFEVAGAVRRDGEAIAKLAGQTQARWQVMWIAATGRLSVATIARRLGLARQSVESTSRDRLLCLSDRFERMLKTAGWMTPLLAKPGFKARVRDRPALGGRSCKSSRRRSRR